MLSQLPKDLRNKKGMNFISQRFQRLDLQFKKKTGNTAEYKELVKIKTSQEVKVIAQIKDDGHKQKH